MSVPRSCAAEHIRRFKIPLCRNSAGVCLVIGVERPLKCFEGDYIHILTGKNWLQCIKTKGTYKADSWKEKRSNQSGMKCNVGSKSWRRDHGNRCGTRPDRKYKIMTSLFFWIVFGFWVVQAKGLWLSCGKQSWCAIMLGAPQLWHLRLALTDCPWDAIPPAVAQFHFPAELGLYRTIVISCFWAAPTVLVPFTCLR